MRMTPHEFALANGWDAGQIEDTARLGVSDADLPRLAAVGLTPDALLAWCLGRIEAEGTPGTTPTTRTITLTGRPPVEIRYAEWPVVAGAAYHDYPREYDFHLSRRWLGLVRVRQHADGRILVYADATYDSAWRIEPDYAQRVGDLLPASATTEQIIDAIRRVHARIDIVDAGHADAWRLLADECIADLPRAAYRDQTQARDASIAEAKATVCDNCDKRAPLSALKPLKEVGELEFPARLDACRWRRMLRGSVGNETPAGECRACGAFAFIIHDDCEPERAQEGGAR